ncbi:uncharacterized protein KY384_006479 [Bacidia gigantensis]|uniref:uncharacterized protein n=1 Tax=Bacidia gigantensis TaxID=2732470 RepID=UPI001D04707D|nr:uncharacterized protein KY384_006479 [Bacidia gigantensis]KAG8528791.1 hypothetical protein KY384_006479 [Bacidia gigantensis]
MSNHSNHSSPATDDHKSTVQYTHGLAGVDLSLDITLTNALWGSIIATCLVILIGRIWQLANAHLRLLFSVNAGPSRYAYWETDRTTIWPWLKKNILYAPLHKKRHNREIMLSKAVNVGTLPSRLHTIILFAYFLSNVIYCVCLDYRGKPQAAVMAELRGRSGHLSMVNMVPLVVLAGRNNPLIWLLRVSFDTYNLFHRWIGRLVALEAVVHTIAWAVNAHAAKGAGATGEALRKSDFLRYGLVGTVAMCIIMVQSLSPIRHAFYETFLHCHQVLALAAIVGVWIHCDIGKLPGSSYIHWVLALWILDRAARFTRISYRSISRQGFSKVTIEAIPGDGVTQASRVSVQLKGPWKYTPGTHAYLYLPKISFWMNHPFSVAWADSRPAPYSSLEKDTLPSSASELGLPQVDRTSDTVHFVIAKRTGMTSKIYDLAATSPSGIITSWGLLEGPYGGNDNLTSYGTAILFAGGIGITHQIGQVRHLLNGHNSFTTATEKIILVWSVKTTESLEWVRPWMDEILSMPNRKQVLKVMLFVTQPRSKKEVASRSERVQMFPGRCNALTVLEKEMDERVGAAVVTTCGPGAFSDEVRAAVNGVVDQGGTVDFVEEAFSW